MDPSSANSIMFGQSNYFVVAKTTCEILSKPYLMDLFIFWRFDTHRWKIQFQITYNEKVLPFIFSTFLSIRLMYCLPVTESNPR
jgi:hypothetical protein